MLSVVVNKKPRRHYYNINTRTAVEFLTIREETVYIRITLATDKDVLCTMHFIIAQYINGISKYGNENNSISSVATKHLPLHRDDEWSTVRLII